MKRHFQPFSASEIAASISAMVKGWPLTFGNDLALTL